MKLYRINGQIQARAEDEHFNPANFVQTLPGRVTYNILPENLNNHSESFELQLLLIVKIVK